MTTTRSFLIGALVTMASAQSNQYSNCEPYSNVISQCEGFGQALLRQMNNTQFNLTDLSPSLVCGSPCFSSSNLVQIRYALAGGCFGAMDTSDGFSALDVGAYFDAVEDFVCAKNPVSNMYCGSYLEGNLSQQVCSVISNAGCCVQNFISSSFHVMELYPSAPSALEVYSNAAICNISIPPSECPGSRNLQAGISTLSSACQANPILSTCKSFGTAMYIEVLRHKIYNTSLPNTTRLCDDPCFNSQNLIYIKELIQDGCFAQLTTDLGSMTGTPAANLTTADIVVHAFAFFNVVESFTCARNPISGQLCSVYLHEGLNGDGCDAVTSAGCCLANFERIRDSFEILDTSFTNGALANLLDTCAVQVTSTTCPGTIITDFGSIDNPVVPSDVPLTASPQCNLYSSVVTECVAVGSHFAQFLSSGGNSTLDPQVICTDPCFTRTKLSLVRSALQLGCFAPIALHGTNGNISDALEAMRIANNLFDFVEDFACSRNGATYCLTYLDQGIATATSNPCTTISQAGCCIQNFIHCDSHIRGVFPDYPTGLQVLELAQTCNVTVPVDVCEGSVQANIGGGGLSAVCEANPIMVDCEDLFEALIQQFITLHRTNTSFIDDFALNHLCNSPCFTSANIAYLKQALVDGCFEQYNNEAELTDNTAELQVHAEAFADAVENFACRKNEYGTYCAELVEQAQSSNNLTPVQECNMLSKAGCCAKSIENSAGDISLLFPQFPSAAVLTEDVDALAQSCNLVLPPACIAPMTSPNTNYNNGVSSSSSGLSSGDDAGIAIGALAFVAIVIIAACYAFKGKKSKSDYSSMYTNETYAGALDA